MSPLFKILLIQTFVAKGSFINYVTQKEGGVRVAVTKCDMRAEEDH
jgi:hypothetical protein